MKKVNLNGKLSLKKETIAKLNDEQMNLVNGGKTVTCNGTCNGCGTSTCDRTIVPCQG